MPDFITNLTAGLNTAQLITSVIVIFTIIHVLLGAAAYLILLERKVCAWVQDRVGPERVGPLGLLQPIADGLKLFTKEEFMPRGVDKALFILAPGLTVLPVLISFVIIPWAGPLDLSTIPFANFSGTVNIAGSSANIGIIFLIATASLGVYGVTIGGWASNNKYSFLGGLRATAQMISYEIPLGVAILCIILLAGTILPAEIVGKQLATTGGPWYLIQHPIIAIIFYVCILAEANRAPFDLAEAESELIGGWHTEYSSMKWALFFMGEYVNLCIGSAFFAILFLGGWSVNPFGIGPDLTSSSAAGNPIWMIMLQAGVMFGKVFALVFLTMMIRWTLPRFRFDQLMRLAWEGMIPASLLLLLLTSFWVFMGWGQFMFVGSLIGLLIIYMVYPHMPGRRDPNRRIGMIGSRFSPPNMRELTGTGGQ